MKAIVALLFFIALACADSEHHHDGFVVKHHEDLVKFRETCGTKLNVASEMMEKYKKWEYPDDEVTRCYMKCMFEQFGFFDEKNGFDVNKVHHQLMGNEKAVDHNDELHQKVAKCADKNTEGSDACTWAYRGGMCFIRSNLHLVKHSVEKQ